MKSVIFHLIAIISAANICAAQNRLTVDSLRVGTLHIIRLNSKQVTIATKNAFIDPGQRDSIYALQQSKYVEVCRLLRVNRIIYERVKADALIFTLNDLFKAYHIDEKYRELPVKVNDDYLEFPESILISKNQIRSVNVVKTKKANYIHVIEIGYLESKKTKDDKEIYIR